MLRATRIAFSCALAATLSTGTTPTRLEAADLRYETSIDVGDGGDLHQRLLEVSRLHGLQDRWPPSLAALRSRLDEDLERFQAVLRSEGFYDARVTGRIDASSSPIQVRLEVEPGPPYLLDRFDLVLPADAPEEARQRALEIAASAKLGRRAVAAEVLELEDDVVAALLARDFPFAELADRDAVIDHAARTLVVRIHLSPGPMATFGDVRISGAGAVGEAFVRRRLTFGSGARYELAYLESTRRRLVETGLFSSVRVRHADEVDEQGRVPVEIELREAKHRSIGAGAKLSSTEGVGLSTFWEHRNLLGAGERLRVTASGSSLEELLALAFRKPDFLAPSQSLLLDASHVREDTDAFESRSSTASAGLERQITGRVFVRGGLLLERSTVEETGALEEDFFLVGVPLTLRRDSSDDLLDPSRGSRLELSVLPFLSALGSDAEFYVGRITDSLYLALDDEAKYVVAGRLSAGTISGAERDAVPADKRFYAGGGGSVRGYGFQLVGPIDADGDPIGGRSLFEAGAELRVRMGETLGLVGFVEGGNVFEEVFPDFDRSLLWGAGVGLRYYTPVGPVRLDLGVPLNRRSGIDDAVQIYVSLGQAF